ncbi:hypothetical protein A2823_01565 [Candidatus Nomurabacteria bacterium RIFCSPHIGHO2_01_FULL_41_91]|uniref:Uncharacterized protein n=1 Tax=Candidatus Nomurabacteria bacterium RIFCSPLOWO2_12_FULL_41_10 TaxID=1801795 RepID=A0A1F6YA36_9BACT|nr:MAG: hypothetical protein A2823_01565 [Candidatus Nomurabacteria bacterium RIFCSPHIGHO2_01_FULL_41_91]OGI84952.1 MAG: hypothetical protein A3F49_00335 [Candidatus Nomurabacteria bacterium RIFCSPHIGHO2_12_FULL_42_19]OGI98049.1 MAG: hypothetical protein A3H56_02735 [Candidatus Nomurabacteria bacterium RIFCSPLOWO2_02_FULL_42_24]OGJ03209.1 MAG: hypothetical protein A3F97_00420 [Candidatus Nomurabacteria bacterium RIFCSPLOWO2_12_FULL_41_10]
MNFGIKQPIKVKRILDKEPGKDGFSVELENGEIVNISLTQWNSEDYKTKNIEETLFSTTKGYIISFSKQQTAVISCF